MSDVTDGQQLFAEFMRLAISTDPVQQMTKAVSAQMLQEWSDQSWLKKQVASRIEKKLDKSLKSQDREFLAETIAFIETHNLAPVLLKHLSPGISSMLDLSLSMLHNLDQLPAQEKRELVDEIIDQATLSKSGRLFSGLAKLINDIHGESPTFFSEKMLPHISLWLEQTDFGELRESLEKSETDIIALITATNELLGQYPAKMVCLYSCLPMLLNIGVAGLLSSLAVQNTMAPELLADILRSLIQDINADRIGQLTNETSELLRKLLTGGALLGEAGNSALADVVAEKTAAVYRELDYRLMNRVAEMLATTREQFDAALVNAARNDPEQASAYFRRIIKPVIDAPRAWSRQVAAVEELLTDEQIAEAVADGLSELDIQELAETVNRFLAIVNTVSPLLAEKGVTPIARFAASLDPCEVSETLRMLTDETVRSLKPMADDIMPHLVRGVTELLRPGADGESPELASALAEFRQVVLNQETT